MCMCVVVPGVPKRCMRLTVLCSFVVWLSKYCMHWCGRYPVLLFRMCVMLAWIGSVVVLFVLNLTATENIDNHPTTLKPQTQTHTDRYTSAHKAALNSCNWSRGRLRKTQCTQPYRNRTRHTIAGKSARTVSMANTTAPFTACFGVWRLTHDLRCGEGQGCLSPAVGRIILPFLCIGGKHQVPIILPFSFWVLRVFGRQRLLFKNKEFD